MVECTGELWVCAIYALLYGEQFGSRDATVGCWDDG